ncbi:hypothetical protein [Alkalibacterium sp. MB6]|uniref:hypothetical protein n=1 Tax=Alkalibacterium sp. MB6 TaxID=2081965 RepID=UPI0013794ECA|nr:hypothetical protein [Alkalibacterium sp. MB6]
MSDKEIQERSKQESCMLCGKPVDSEDVGYVWSSVDFEHHPCHQRCWDNLLETADDDDLEDL